MIWDGEKIIGKEISPNERMLEICSNGLSTHIMAIEQIKCMGMAVADSVFDTVFWTGRFCQTWEQARGKWERVPRMAVKMHICQNSRARDSNIIQALKDRFEQDLLPKQRPKGILKGLKADLWQAFALAVFYFDTRMPNQAQDQRSTRG